MSFHCLQVYDFHLPCRIAINKQCERVDSWEDTDWWWNKWALYETILRSCRLNLMLPDWPLNGSIRGDTSNTLELELQNALCMSIESLSLFILPALRWILNFFDLSRYVSYQTFQLHDGILCQRYYPFNIMTLSHFFGSCGCKSCNSKVVDV